MEYITGIGSREAPLDILYLMESIGEYYCNHGYALRSGGADGSDKAFQQGAMKARRFPSIGMEIYLPWNGFNGFNKGLGYIVAPYLGNYDEATYIASQLHPAWDKLTNGPRSLHTRNVYQVLGIDLVTPSKAVILWAKPNNNGTVKGGTNTAYLLAKNANIPTFNLYEDSVREMVTRKLGIKNLEGGI